MLKPARTSFRPPRILRQEASLCRELARGAVSPRTAHELEDIARDLESEAAQLDIDEKIAIEADD